MNRNDMEFAVQKIRTQYTKKEHTQLDTLLALDKTVRRPALVFAWIFGVIGSLVLGTGMTLAMQVIEPGTYFGITIAENMMLPGIVIGLVGILMLSVNYPFYRALLTHRKTKYGSQIVALSDEIMKG